MRDLQPVLEHVTRIPGVRGAQVVSADDGLVVAEALMEGVESGAVAALAASLVRRLGRATHAAGLKGMSTMFLGAERGGLLVMGAADGLLVVAITSPGANLGLLRLALRETAERLA